jgi:hypothetical protein
LPVSLHGGLGLSRAATFGYEKVYPNNPLTLLFSLGPRNVAVEHTAGSRFGIVGVAEHLAGSLQNRLG